MAPTTFVRLGIVLRNMFLYKKEERERFSSKRLHRGKRLFISDNGRNYSPEKGVTNGPKAGGLFELTLVSRTLYAIYIKTFHPAWCTVPNVIY